MLELFEVSLGHGAHVCILQTGVVLVDSVDVSFGPEVDVGETALVGPLFAHVHINLIIYQSYFSALLARYTTSLSWS